MNALREKIRFAHRIVRRCWRWLDAQRAAGRLPERQGHPGMAPEAAVIDAMPWRLRQAGWLAAFGALCPGDSLRLNNHLRRASWLRLQLDDLRQQAKPRLPA